MKKLPIHPNLVQYIDCKEDSKYFYIVMELASQGTLHDFVKKQNGWKLPETSVLSMFVQVVNAVKVLHDNKVLHRDLKPENILISSDGVVKVGDFGISR